MLSSVDGQMATEGPRRNRLCRHLGAVTLFAALTLAAAYPNILRVGDALPDLGDPSLTCWSLAWGARKILALDFVGLFDGNVFHPSP